MSFFSCTSPVSNIPPSDATLYQTINLCLIPNPRGSINLTLKISSTNPLLPYNLNFVTCTSCSHSGYRLKSMAHTNSFSVQDFPSQPIRSATLSHKHAPNAQPLSSDAPPLPPRMVRRNTEMVSAPHIHMKRSLSVQEIKPPIVPKRDTAVPKPQPQSMTLKEFTATYADHLPLSIITQTGYYGTNSHVQISVGEKLHVHLTKTTEVVLATNHGNETYSIPLNSSCRLSLIYDPLEDMSQALAGYVFKGARTLASAEPLPKVVCALTAWRKGKIALEINEILVVKKKSNEKNELEVFSVSNDQTKFLPLSCPTKFTTDPKLLPMRMYLLDIVSNISNAFPCKALLQATDETRKSFGSQHLTLLRATSETTILCSYPGSSDQFDLPVDLPEVTVTVCHNKDVAEDLQLYESTKSIISNYNPAYITCCRDDVTRSTYETQSKIYSSVREGFETVGICINASQDILRQIKGTVPHEAAQQVHVEHEICSEKSGPSNAFIQNDIPNSASMEHIKRTNRNFLTAINEEMVRMRK